MKNDDLPVLNRSVLPKVSEEHIEKLDERFFNLPERILMFGTGVFLRGLVSHVIHEANTRGDFEGRIVMVQSTGSERAQQINRQDGLYTLQQIGVKENEACESLSIVPSVSRAVSAYDDWHSVLKLADDPQMNIIVSNTTEVGISFNSRDALDSVPPQSFPAKLTAWLYRKYATLGEDSGKQVILPCELIADNGDYLKSLVQRYIGEWILENDFKQWVDQHCIFANTLVDRIVPGRPDEDKLKQLQQRAGYSDQLWIEAEWYRLWAIEGDERVLRNRLGFARNDNSVVISNDITPYIERKVRILNGSHTAMTPVSLLAGNRTVYQTTTDTNTRNYLNHLIFNEIVPSLRLDRKMVESFANEVLDRFANPYIDHRLKQICLYATTKIEKRILPVIHAYYNNNARWPEGLLLGIAAHLVLLKNVEPQTDGYTLTLGDDRHHVHDERAREISKLWKTGGTVPEIVEKILSSNEIWTDDSALMKRLIPDIKELVTEIVDYGIETPLRRLAEESIKK